jgi:DNA-binding transcriptional MerR regulator
MATTNTDINHINLFPIGELSSRTQVHTVTLRAWERRYGLLKPQRTAKGHRLYSEADVATIERVLSLVARGVPLGKVKPLLEDGTSLAIDNDGQDLWQELINSLLEAICSYSVTKVEHLIHQTLANYPVPVCSERWLEPVFAELTLRKDHGAALSFAESELMRYACLRIKTGGGQNKPVAINLIAGKQTPMWRLVLLALQLNDAKFSVCLLNRPFTLVAGIELALQWADNFTLFYQDGVWDQQEQTKAKLALVENERLLMCGTAPGLAQINDQERVFTELTECLHSLSKHNSSDG